MSKFLYKLQSEEQLAVKASSSATAQPNVYPDVVGATRRVTSANQDVTPGEHVIAGEVVMVFPICQEDVNRSRFLAILIFAPASDFSNQLELVS
ncbi:hypothetical protein T05_14506 [Trichinella murrelli]|uniref:Uncharacterized protein n=1 Tax=Trichinella murrelli TaxID=144512 RepID=A0A0V0TD54_9BILA|nr:hypothetical protein T05_14506 [Trichinella murrelli]